MSDRSAYRTYNEMVATLRMAAEDDILSKSQRKAAARLYERFLDVLDTMNNAEQRVFTEYSA